MTVDMLAATFFWPEGTSLQVREDIEPDGESESRSGGSGRRSVSRNAG